MSILAMLMIATNTRRDIAYSLIASGALIRYGKLRHFSGKGMGLADIISCVAKHTRRTKISSHHKKFLVKLIAGGGLCQQE